MTRTTPNLPVPAGATAGEWDSVDLDDHLCRSLEWSRHDTDKVGVGIDGFQHATGEVTRRISLYEADQELDAGEARALAVKLIEAAAAMDGLA